jgi:hypothetical protein
MKLISYARANLPAILLLLFSFGTMAQGLQVGEGAHLVLNGSPSIVLNNTGIINNGYVTAGNSNVLFTGNKTTAASFIGGSRPVAFYNIIIGKDANDVELDNNISVGGNVVMKNGNLQLNNHTLDLGNTGIIAGERNSSSITGKHGGVIKVNAILYAGQPVNPGNIGVEINSTTSAGFTVITRGHVQQTNATGEQSIQRYFDIVPSHNTNLHATLRFYYFDDELAGKNGNELSVFSNAQGQRDWTQWGKDNADAIKGWVAKNNIDQLSRFTLAIGNAKEQLTGTAVQLFPNPLHDAFTVLLNSNTEKDEAIALYDQLGRQLEVKKIHLLPGINRLQWNVQQYAAGSYHLVFKTMNVKNIKLIKQ